MVLHHHWWSSEKECETATWHRRKKQTGTPACGITERLHASMPSQRTKIFPFIKTSRFAPFTFRRSSRAGYDRLPSQIKRGTKNTDVNLSTSLFVIVRFLLFTDAIAVSLLTWEIMFFFFFRSLTHHCISGSIKVKLCALLTRYMISIHSDVTYNLAVDSNQISKKYRSPCIMFPRANVGPKSFKYRQDRVDKDYKNSVIYLTIVNPQPSQLLTSSINCTSLIQISNLHFNSIQYWKKYSTRDSFRSAMSVGNSYGTIRVT